MTKELRAVLRCGLALALLITVSMGAFAQRRTFVAGELLISVRANTARAEVDNIASTVNASVVRFFGSLDYQHLRDTYHLRIAGGPVVPDATTLVAVNRLRTDNRVLYAGLNKIYQWFDTTPNDQRYPQQWHLPLLNMPKVWDIEKGQPSVIIAIEDSGCDVSHPDLAPRLFMPLNAGAGNPTDLTDNVPHGTHVIGIAGAATDNGQGVAGITWQNVKMMPIKLGDAPDLVAAVAGLVYAEGKGVNVVNMSFGGGAASDTPDLSDPLNAKILDLAKKGVIFTISAGNSGPGSPPINPANMANVNDPAKINIYCVASCGRFKQIAPYSSVRPYTTITTPGGDASTGPGDAILSTLPANLGGPYGYEEGTSMSAPALAGVVGILLSIPGVTPADVRDALITTTNPAFNPPTPQFGYGVVDAFAAVLKVATAVTIITPDGTGGKAGTPIRQPDPLESLHVNLRIQIRQITPANLTVSLDSVPVTDYAITNVLTTKPDPNDPNAPPIPTRYDVVFERDMAPGTHRVEVGGTSPGPPPRTVGDTRTFIISPHVVQAGRSMISIPFFQDRNNDNVGDPDVTPEYYFGQGFQLARWLPDQQRYVFYSPFGPRDAGASFAPGDIVTHQDGDLTPRFPLGLGFWIDSDSLKPILTYGKGLADRAFVIPLRGNGNGNTSNVSWNMIGGPFPFDVPFNAVLVDTPNDGRLSIAEAVARGYILPNLYTFDGGIGYLFDSLPGGLLREWTGYWIGVISGPDISLVVPPVKASRAAALPSRAPAVNGNGWSLRLRTNVKGLHDTYNFIGVSSRASDGYDLSDVMKPPMVTPYVSLGVNHDDWGRMSGLYARDLRAPGSFKTWNVVAATDQKDSAVSVSWDNAGSLPRSVKLTIKDLTTGQTVDMRTRSSISFNSGADAAPRRFAITAAPASGSGVIRISNVVVQPSGGRASGASVIGFTISGDATYDVKVLNASGSVIGTVATRAASVGDQRVIWNGKDAAGRSVPAGTYIVQIRAIGADNESVRAIQPFALIR